MPTGRDTFRRAIEMQGPQRLPAILDVNLDWLIEKDGQKQERIRELHSELPQDLLFVSVAGPEKPICRHRRCKEERYDR